MKRWLSFVASLVVLTGAALLGVTPTAFAADPACVPTQDSVSTGPSGYVSFDLPSPCVVGSEFASLASSMNDLQVYDSSFAYVGCSAGCAADGYSTAHWPAVGDTLVADAVPALYDMGPSVDGVAVWSASSGPPDGYVSPVTTAFASSPSPSPSPSSTTVSGGGGGGSAADSGAVGAVSTAAGSLRDTLMAATSTVLPYAAVLAALVAAWLLTRRWVR